ncbi:SDR family oxidoreductase [Patulibacter sp.]|uniref:SDR family oxidoreductase n=1 Tax=Patulibacter sp. TaxID=1912859 RepID=UPI00272827C5|nr:SDR family oxidoreductase [Patulibacter sp.]MDO9408155.1 SDR family oxidoreductase [Patulibacter sp.]
MEIAGQVVVVTGGASGIGRAMAERFLADGARGVVVVDLDEAAARAVAEPGGERALGLGCDVTDPDGLAAVLAAATDAFGPVDLFCANAGVAVGEDEQTADDVWDLALAVNVRAHVLAARLLVPGWIERGHGYFLSTASAAGLLTQVGSAPYSVSKHAAVAFSEWLSVTYGDRGLRVSCLCPMGVDTPLLNGGFSAQDGETTTAAAVVRDAGRVLAPDDVAGIVVDGLREERFLILPHPEVATFEGRRAADHDRWIAGMRRLQAAAGGA